MSYLIFSVYQGTDLDQLNTEHIKHFLNKLSIPFRQLIGSYKGKSEESFLVDSQYYDTVIEIVSDYNQESILNVQTSSTCSDAFLDFIVGDTEYLGEFGQISQSEAVKLDGYTLDPITGIYWGVL